MKALHLRVAAAVAQRARRAVRDRGMRRGIQEYAVIGDREQARQFVADQHDGLSEAIAKLQDQVVEPARGGPDRDRPTARRRTGSRDRAPARVRRPARLRMPPLSSDGDSAAACSMPTRASFSRTRLSMAALSRRGEHAQRQRHVLGHRQRAPQRAVLEQHSKAAADGFPPRRVAAPVVLAADEHPARRRAQQPDHRTQHRALAAAAAAHHREDAAAPYGKAEVPLDHLAASRRVRGLAPRGSSPPACTTGPAATGSVSRGIGDHGEHRIERDGADNADHHRPRSLHCRHRRRCVRPSARSGSSSPRSSGRKQGSWQTRNTNWPTGSDVRVCWM